MTSKQPIDAVKRDAPIVADDAAAAVGVGQTGDDAGSAALHDLRRVGVEHAVIVRFAIFGECLVDQRIGLQARRLKAGLNHAQSAVRKYRPLKWLIGL